MTAILQGMIIITFVPFFTHKNTSPTPDSVCEYSSNIQKWWWWWRRRRRRWWW